MRGGPGRCRAAPRDPPRAGSETAPRGGREHGELVLPAGGPRGRAPRVRGELHHRRPFDPDTRRRRRGPQSGSRDPPPAQAGDAPRGRRPHRVRGGPVRESGYIVRPEHFLRSLRKDLHLSPSETRLPRRAVHVFGGDEFRAVRRALRGTRSAWSRWVAIGRADRVPAVVFRSHIGAPASSMDLEEMGVLGVREVIAFGSCGSIVKDLRIGDFVVPGFAVSDEGTSRHYGAPRRPAPDPGLRATILAAGARSGLAIGGGGVWTTEAPHRGQPE